ncbi:hypothetical protein HID58_042297, partial [Brassica napus]
YSNEVTDLGCSSSDNVNHAVCFTNGIGEEKNFKIQMKIIRGSLYFELVSPCNTSILGFIVSMLLLFILPSSIPPVINVVTP